jgi:hypothetical protein
MIIDLEIIQKMWDEDSKIDIDNLHTESLNIPSLHAKYFNIYNNILLLKKQAEQRRRNIRNEKYEYYTGKADPEVYVENPFFKKIRDKDTLQKYMEADQSLSQATLKVEYYDVMISYVQDIIKMIHNRTYQIKNAIEYQRFMSGLG